MYPPGSDDTKMKTETVVKVIIDIAMTVLFLILMAYHITGNLLHEWLGAVLYLLFIAHNLFNLKWYRAIPKGRYTSVRIVRTTINLLLLIAMLGLIISGMMLSRDVFGFLNIRAGRAGRRFHVASAAWGFVLMSAHLGFHWGAVTGMVQKLTPKALLSTTLYICRIAAIALSGYGICSFIARQVWRKTAFLVGYTFFDYKEPAFWFFADYVSIMGLFACIAYFCMKKQQTQRSSTGGS